MKKRFVLLALLLPVIAHAQENSAPEKFALVIGNGAYTGLSPLANPVNDAADMAAALKDLGFTVETVLNGSIQQMDSGVLRLKNRLSVSADAYGFFFYAGHGVQSTGENYLIPVDADIPGDNYLRTRAVSVQVVLDELNDAGNRLNVVVLDACRDNPFGWSRSGTRGLAVVGNQPADSIVVYATSAGQRASDGRGRNGLFTGQLLKNLKTPGLEVKELFNRTGSDVSTVSGRQQIPAVYNQFFGEAYLGAEPAAAVFEFGAVSTAMGALEISTVTGGTVEITGAGIHQKLTMPEWGHLPVAKISAGSYLLIMRYADGKTEERTVAVDREKTMTVDFSYRPPAPSPLPEKKPAQNANPEAARFTALGASVGSTFAAPLVVGTVRGTFAPLPYSFAEAGLDLGMLSGIADSGYYSVYPYVRYALFLPFADSGGWYAGAGGGWMFGEHTFPEGRVPVSTGALDIITGVNLWNAVDLSVTLRTNFSGANVKVSTGYTYRF